MLAVIAAIAGPAVIGVVFGREFVLTPAIIAIVTFSGGLVGAMCVTGALALARGRHRVYAIGWVASAIIAIAALTIGLPLDVGIAVSLCFSPLIGGTIHVIGSRKPGP